MADSLLEFDLQASGVGKGKNVFKGIIKENLKHFMDFEVPNILFDYYSDVGMEEEITTSRKLQRMGATGSIYDRVSDHIKSSVSHISRGNVFLTFGASDSAEIGDLDAGVTGSRGEDIAAILQYGKRAATEPLSKNIIAKPTAGAIRRRLFGGFAKAAKGKFGQGRGGGNFLLPEGWKSPAFEGIDFLAGAEERLRKKHEGPELRNRIRAAASKYKYKKGGKK
tara:strand:+ start:4160 stop:4828 length:669 start_codon:yes stop_codon:yes gene_type:complete